MRNLHVISHTHWDREWYQTFQQFRLRLVHLVDGLLELLENDPGFKYFMLDGQTIVLEDYLFMRPENEAVLREHIRKGRILIGPWHILPDMFLVGPEAHIRNLLQGERTTRRFGPNMPIGYMPDSFGHPGQMPQVLQGFGIDAACLWRGPDEEPAELFWQSPDGSRVFLAYLRDSYSNGASLRADNPPVFAQSISAAADSLAAHSAASDYLIMLGTDHMQPPPDTSTAIAYADETLKDTRVLHSTLPEYMRAVRSSISDERLPVVQGELRACRRMHLLPGVLSTRMWIKQRNHASETLLTKWAEPFTTWQELSTGNPKASKILTHKSHILHQAWRLLMENHPHDSICGCSIDQVHEEMKPRFDQADQIAGELTRQSLAAIAETVSTDGQPAALNAIVVFNPSTSARSDAVWAEVRLPHGVSAFEIVDELGNVIPHETSNAGARELIDMILDPKGVRESFKAVHEGMVANLGVHSFTAQRTGETVHIHIVMSRGPADKEVWERGLREAQSLLEDPGISAYHIRASLGDVIQAVFSAPANPGLGWRSFYVRARESDAPPMTLTNPFVRALLPVVSRFVADTSIGRSLLSRGNGQASAERSRRIENEFFIVEAEADGTLAITDKRTGRRYDKLNRFVDGGDCGDEYNYSPPDVDSRQVARLVNVAAHQGSVLQTLTLTLVLNVPPRLNRDRKARVAKEKFFVALPVVCCITLSAGVARVDVNTTVENNAQDHRLRVHFPVPVETDSVDYDGHFEVVRRKIGVPEFDRKTWVEDPRPEVPQRAFTDVSDGRAGLMLANRGLPEVQVLKTGKGTEIALTLLRCVGWLSRDDFQTRRGHAGPGEETPGAQVPGTWSFDYSIIPHAAAPPYELAHDFEMPLRAITTTVHAGSLPQKGSFAAVQATAGGTEREAFVVSAVKPGENGRGWIIRGYNLGAESLDVTITPWKRFKSAARVNLAEQKQADLTPDKVTGSVRFPVKGHEIATIWFDG